MGIILLAIGLMVLLFIILGYSGKGRNRYWKLNKWQALSPLALLIVLFTSFAQIAGNEVGIIYDPLKGGIQETPLYEGFHFKAPWSNVYKISTTLREVNFEVGAQTGEILKENEDGTFEENGGGQWITYEVTLHYRVEIQNAFKFYRNFGGNSASKDILYAKIRSSLQNNSVKHDVFTILKGGLVDVRIGVEKELKEELSKLGITVESFIIGDVDAGPSIEKVLEDEAIAAKQKEIATKEQEAALIREKTKQLQAEIEAIRIKIEAEAKAEAEALLKSVTFNAIKLMYESQFKTSEEKATFETQISENPSGQYGYLTISQVAEIVLKQLYYDTWDGKLPEIILDDAAGIIINP